MFRYAGENEIKSGEGEFQAHNDKTLLVFKHGEIVWHFFENSQGELLCRFFKEGLWGETFRLLKHFGGNYALSLGRNGSVCLAARKYGNSLNCFFWDGGSWQGGEVVVFSQKEKIENIALTIDARGVVHLAYQLFNPGGWSMQHLRYFSGSWDEVREIDKGTGESSNKGGLAADSRGYVHFIYRQYEQQSCSLLHWFFSEENGWKKGSLNVQDKDSLSAALVIDQYDNLHLTYVRPDRENYRVRYQRLVSGGWLKGGWREEKILSLPGENAYSPILLAEEKRVIIVWQQVGGIYYRISKDGGSSWEEVKSHETMKEFLKIIMNSLSRDERQGINLIQSFNTAASQLSLLTAYLWASKEMEQFDEKQEKASAPFYRGGLLFKVASENGKIKRMMFETEDLRLSGELMRSTIIEQDAVLAGLRREMEQYCEKNEKLDRETKYYKNLNKELEEKLKAETIGCAEKLKEAEEQLQVVAGQLTEEAESHEKTKIRLQSLRAELKKQLEEEMHKRLAAEEELEREKNTSLWEKLRRSIKNNEN